MLVCEKFSWCYFGGSYLDNEREFKHGTKCQTSTINSIFYSFSLILKNAFFVLKKLFESRQNSARMAEFCQAGKNPIWRKNAAGIPFSVQDWISSLYSRNIVCLSPGFVCPFPVFLAVFFLLTNFWTLTNLFSW